MVVRRGLGEWGNEERERGCDDIEGERRVYSAQVRRRGTKRWGQLKKSDSGKKREQISGF